jgi:uracil-DNA glycosylase family 4
LRGNTDNPPIVVVCDPPTQDAIKAGLPMSAPAFKMFADIAFANGLTREDFLFVALCPPMPKNIINSDSKRWKHVEPHTADIHDYIRTTACRCVVTFGKEATRTILGRPVAITKSRGKALQIEDKVVLPMLAPSMVLRVPDHHPTFVTDVETLGRLKADNYVLHERESVELDYRWCEDLSELIEMHPGALAVDTEGTGLRWYDPSVEVICVQLTYAPGKALVCPVDPVYWPEWNQRPRSRLKLIQQLKCLLEDPTIKKIGHNLKFDIHMLRKLGIEVANWSDDTQLKAFAVDENMMEKSLDECTRRWVPEMAGYADLFNQTTDKSKMREVPRDEMLQIRWRRHRRDVPAERSPDRPCWLATPAKSAFTNWCRCGRCARSLMSSNGSAC